MAFTASVAQQAALPVQAGARTYTIPGNVTAASPTGAAIALNSDLTTFALINTGTLDNAASLALQGSINGVAFYPVLVNGTAKTWTGTQINAGVVESLQLKATHIRFVLTPGTTTGSNGVQPRVLD